MLIKSLPKIAARILHNTHVGQSRMKEKFDLITEAYGESVVLDDFEKWCQEMVDKHLNPRYPITEYIKIIDDRLGGGFTEPSQSQFDVNDPRILSISSPCYEMTGYLPSPKVVLALLNAFNSEEIIFALEEYVSSLSEKELKIGAKQFFTEGGAAAVIYARRNRFKSSEISHNPSRL